MNFDFSALNFETIDSNINAYPDMYINQNGVTFTKKVLEDLGYPAYVLCLYMPRRRYSQSVCARVTSRRGLSFLSCGVNRRAL